jgi:ubiquinone/menaquinone biosynthesis C-methylase UbiE
MAQMSALERWLVNSPFRAWLHGAEIRAFVRWARLRPNADILDMGCGRGVSTTHILRLARPRNLAAFDYDPSMVNRARRRLGSADNVDLRVADATDMPYDTGSFDAVFESGVIHHIPDWKAAIREVSRVLRPGGQFCFAEPSRGRILRGLYRFVRHDPTSTFDADDLRSVFRDSGLAIEGPIRRLPLWDICGVARLTRSG